MAILLYFFRHSVAAGRNQDGTFLTPAEVIQESELDLPDTTPVTFNGMNLEERLKTAGTSNSDIYYDSNEMVYYSHIRNQPARDQDLDLIEVTYKPVVLDGVLRWYIWHSEEFTGANLWPDTTWMLSNPPPVYTPGDGGQSTVTRISVVVTPGYATIDCTSVFSYVPETP